MRKLLVASLAAAGALAVPSAAPAADTSIVSAYGCYLNGGQVSRPAGTDVVVRFGWAAKTRGLVEDFLHAQATTVSVNDGPATDVSGGYDAPSTYPLAGWASFVTYDTGVVLAPGESMTFELAATVSHALTDGATFANGESGKPLFADPGTLFAARCTVTGV